MVKYCFIKSCQSTQYKRVKSENISLTFFGFPKDPLLREKWIEVLVSAGQNMARLSKSSHICSLHFDENCIQTIGLSPGRLKPDSVPTKFLNAPRESTADIENKSPNTSSMKTESNQDEENIYQSVDQYEENICENIQCEANIYETPSKKRICYAGDIKSEDIGKMSPKTLIKSVKILKSSCEKKDKTINQLRVQQYYQKKKIESLQTLLHELRTKGLLSEASSDILQVQLKSYSTEELNETGKI